MKNYNNSLSSEIHRNFFVKSITKNFHQWVVSRKTLGIDIQENDVRGNSVKTSFRQHFLSQMSRTSSLRRCFQTNFVSSEMYCKYGFLRIPDMFHTHINGQHFLVMKGDATPRNIPKIYELETQWELTKIEWVYSLINGTYPNISWYLHDT